MDTALVAAAECAEVSALVDEVYQSFLGHELNLHNSTCVTNV